jgi:hypothetical protein
MRFAGFEVVFLVKVILALLEPFMIACDPCSQTFIIRQLPTALAFG